MLHENMIIGSEKFQYKWIENWVTIPDTPSGKLNGRTHGVVVTEENLIVIFNQANPAILILDADGNLIKSWGERFVGAHGLTLIKTDSEEYLWLTDKFSGEVLKTTLEGVEVLNVEKPALDIYKENKYSPTWVAEFEEEKNGNGDIWIADGYGSSLVHRYDKNGNYIQTITGEKGAGRFNCPHSLFFDYRKNEPELYIADRGNKRFQVYDLEGKFKRVFGDDFLGCPCGGIVKDDLLYVPELCARIAILDKEDNLICYLGQNENTCNIPTWPNHPKELIQPGKFNSPHHLAVDKNNNIYVVEWIIGGRITKLEKIIGKK
jgi:hypothetical protein